MMCPIRARLPFLVKGSEWNVTTRDSTKTMRYILLACVLGRRFHIEISLFSRQDLYGERRFNVSLHRRSAFRNNLHVVHRRDFRSVRKAQQLTTFVRQRLSAHIPF
jgi:hypothetical protein